MLRRKKEDKQADGTPLITLPDRIVQVLPCQFDRDEQEFYDALAQKVELTLNKFVKSGEMMKNYTCVMVLLLRLRQGEILFVFSVCCTQAHDRRLQRATIRRWSRKTSRLTVKPLSRRVQRTIRT